MTAAATTLTYESTSRTAKAGALTLHYHEAGPADVRADASADVRADASADARADASAVIMLHGGGPGASAWSNFGANLPVFAGHFRTLLIDQPCFGRSDKTAPDRDYFSFSARAVAALMDEIGLEKAHFIGNSLGGGTATRLAIDHPDKVGRLLLMGPGGISVNLFSPDPTEGIKRLFAFNASPAPSREQMRDFLLTMAYDPAIVTDAFVEERYVQATDPEARLGAARMGAAFATWPQESQLWREGHRVTQPTLLTWGREDRTNPLDGALVALRTIPDARLHVFPHCGHWAQVERFDEFNRLALDFFSH